MALRIRLKRFGRKQRPFYRLVVAEHTVPRDGESIEIVGRYNPLETPVLFEINEERVKYWMSVGAQPTETVERLLSEKGLVPKPVKQSKDAGVSRKEKKARK